MNELALFAGAGGGILGGALLGWRTVCAVERDAYCAQVLAQRQNDRSLPPFPIWSDVQSFDGRPWRGIVDVVSGGFPCQDISTAGKGAGIDGERSGLWRHMARIIGEVRPGFVLVENVTALVSRGLERVLGDLSALGYDATWTVVGAADVGAPHQRDRIWIVAHARSVRFDQVEHKLPEGEQNARRSGQNVSNAVRNGRPELEVQQVGEQRRSAETYARHDGPQGSMAHANGIGKQQSRRRVKKKRGRSFDGSEALAFPDRQSLAIGEGQREDRIQELTPIAGKGWWAVEPSVGRVVDGMAARVDRLRALGNGQVPLSMVEAWQRLTR